MQWEDIFPVQIFFSQVRRWGRRQGRKFEKRGWQSRTSANSHSEHRYFKPKNFLVSYRFWIMLPGSLKMGAWQKFSHCALFERFISAKPGKSARTLFGWTVSKRLTISRLYPLASSSSRNSRLEAGALDPMVSIPRSLPFSLPHSRFQVSLENQETFCIITKPHTQNVLHELLYKIACS